jgi:hypothetical protein
LTALPDELAPTAALLTDADIRLVKNSRTRWAYKAARKRELTRPYVEIYRKSRENFFGMYDWGGPGTSDRLALDVWKAATFIQAVVTATVTASADVDDEFETAREGALDERYVRHRHREKKTASGRSRPF